MLYRKGDHFSKGEKTIWIADIDNIKYTILDIQNKIGGKIRERTILTNSLSDYVGRYGYTHHR